MTLNLTSTDPENSARVERGAYVKESSTDLHYLQFTKAITLSSFYFCICLFHKYNLCLIGDNNSLNLFICLTA